MSVESAKAFLARVKSDATFRASIEKAKDKKGRQTLIRAAGFEFSKADLGKAKGEIPLADLGKVVGGAGVAAACIQVEGEIEG